MQMRLSTIDPPPAPRPSACLFPSVFRPALSLPPHSVPRSGSQMRAPAPPPTPGCSHQLQVHSSSSLFEHGRHIWRTSLPAVGLAFSRRSRTRYGYGRDLPIAPPPVRPRSRAWHSLALSECWFVVFTEIVLTAVPVQPAQAGRPAGPWRQERYKPPYAPSGRTLEGLL
ncbi:hypothetical protein OH77DRAFT_302034 [Trametes cingulata]|nr:hypothetical protein OH77DRAFT_302034 [Trametes cingulata]